MNIERRTIEPIAEEHGIPRRSLQRFVGAGNWKDGPVRQALRSAVARDLGHRDAVLVLDGTGFEKSGGHSVGVKRQWCGRLGKVENCQVAQLLVYAAPKGASLVDAELYLLQEWLDDPARREEAHIPKEIKFRKGWQLSLQLLDRCREELPHGWVVGDDEYGRVLALRDALNGRGEQYLLDVPCNTRVRRGDGRELRVDRLERELRPPSFASVTVRDGEKGPLEVEVYSERITQVRERRERHRERRETLVIIRNPSTGETRYAMSNGRGVQARKLGRVAATRHFIEEAIQAGKADAGMDEYEVRSWVGWHHHMTLSMLALHFLVMERHRAKRGLRRSRSPRSGGLSLGCSPCPR